MVVLQRQPDLLEVIAALHSAAWLGSRIERRKHPNTNEKHAGGGSNNPSNRPSCEHVNQKGDCRNCGQSHYQCCKLARMTCPRIGCTKQRNERCQNKQFAQSKSHELYSFRL